MKTHEIAYGQRLLRGQPPSYERLQARLAGDGSEPTTSRVYCTAVGGVC